MKTTINLLKKENKNTGDFLIMKKAKEKTSLIWRNIHSFATSKKDFFYAKKILSSAVILGSLSILVSCACTNPVQPPPDPDLSTDILGLGNMDKQNIVFFPENTVTFTRSVDFNISNFITSSPGADESISNDNSLIIRITGVFGGGSVVNSNVGITITASPGADVALFNTNNLNINLTTGVISGSLKLNQRLDFENPRDAGDQPTNNQYEIVNFNVTANNAEGFNTNFKLLVQITDERIEPTKLEILVDAYHLATNDQIRSINEFYLYEDANAPDPTTGSDANNFLSGSLVTNPTVIGEVDPSSSIANLYDGDDSTSGFLTATAINSSSKTYHRLTLNFNEKVNIKKLAIRGRQIGGYQGFIFIMRDENDNILYVRRANGTDARASGTDADALSTYSLVPSYVSSLYPISDFDIRINNLDFDIGENTTNVILFDNFSVTRGYEYERGFVSFSQPPGADFDKFDLDNAYFLYNELNGITFKLPPDAEAPTDADSNNVYEVGMVTITNVDGGHTNFNLSVKVVNMPSTVSLSTNAIRVSVLSSESLVIADLTEVVIASNFENGVSLGRGTYDYDLTGDNAGDFEIIGNALYRVNSNYESTDYTNLQVRYNTDGGGAFAELNVTIFVRGLFWKEISRNSLAVNRRQFQTVVLNNNDIVVMGGHTPYFPHLHPDSLGPYAYQLDNGIWRSSDGGTNWSKIPTTGHWVTRGAFQALVLANNDILVMGGKRLDNELLNDIWRSSDGGASWSQIPVTGHWSARADFQALVLPNNDIIVMGGKTTNELLNDIWRSSDGGASWTQIPATGHWSARTAFQAVILTNNDILVMGGGPSYRMLNDVWRSSDGGTNWTQIPATGHWSARTAFQAIVLANNNILVMGGWDHNISITDTWLSSDGGATWIEIPSKNKWQARLNFQAVVLPSDLVLVIGGDNQYRFIVPQFDRPLVIDEDNQYRSYTGRSYLGGDPISTIHHIRY